MGRLPANLSLRVFTQSESETDVSGDAADGPLRAQKQKSRSFSRLIPTGARLVLRWSFRQPGSPHCFLEFRKIIKAPIRARKVFEGRNTLRWVESLQSRYCLMCLLHTA